MKVSIYEKSRPLRFHQTKKFVLELLDMCYWWKNPFENMARLNISKPSIPRRTRSSTTPKFAIAISVPSFPFQKRLPNHCVEKYLLIDSFNLSRRSRDAIICIVASTSMKFQPQLFLPKPSVSFLDSWPPLDQCPSRWSLPSLRRSLMLGILRDTLIVEVL